MLFHYLVIPDDLGHMTSPGYCLLADYAEIKQTSVTHFLQVSTPVLTLDNTFN